MSLRRGFKSEAELTALEVRAELNLLTTEPLDPRRLARHLDVLVIGLSELSSDAPLAAHYFSSDGRSQFSAATVFEGTARVIVLNDTHSRARQASSIAHELSHAILRHMPTAALDERGCRLWDQTNEEEADWLAGALLVPAPAAWKIAKNRLSLDRAAEDFGVSEQMMRFRMNVTGAAKAQLR